MNMCPIVRMGLFLLKAPSGFMAAISEKLYGFFDESGTHEKAKVLAVGGWVASVQEWDDFDHYWQAALKKHGVTTFHFTDCDNSHGEFQGWSGPKKIALIKDLIRVMCHHDVHGFCAAITMPDYSSVVRGSGSVLEKKHSPYVMCQSYLIEKICQQIDRPVLYVFEEQQEFQAHGASNFADIKSRFPERVSKMAGIKYLPKTKFSGLQAADFLVYETAKSHANRVYDPSRPARQSLLALLKCKKKNMHAVSFDETAARQWLEWNPPDEK